MTTKNGLTFDAIANRLNELGVNYSRIDRGTEREVMDVPGYGEIHPDAGADGFTGFVVRTFEPGFAEVSISDDDLMAELEELGEMAEAIR